MNTSIWQRLQNTIRRPPGRQISISLDRETREILESLAAEERHAVEKVASELLRIAATRRQEAEANLERWQELSPREKQVAALICLNYTNREIARRLIIAPETVKSHVRNILSKTNTHSKIALRQALADWDFHEWLDTSI